jgi:hypothetical protein
MADSLQPRAVGEWNIKYPGRKTFNIAVSDLASWSCRSTTRGKHSKNTRGARTTASPGDTCDSLKGVRHTVEVRKELRQREAGSPGSARLGDLRVLEHQRVRSWMRADFQMQYRRRQRWMSTSSSLKKTARQLTSGASDTLVTAYDQPAGRRV